MEEPSATPEESPPRDLSSEIKSCENDCNCGSSRGTIGISMPICFLVKEQAKSFIAIQDLQKRLSHVEDVQEDVIDAIIEFRNYLSDTKSFNSANPMVTSNSLSVTRSPSATFFKSNSTSKSNENNVPSAAESSVEVPHSALKPRSYSSKDCDYRFSEYGRTQAIASVSELSQKHFDLIKSKDSALDSDKQDSGLDSDCREHHEIHPSLIKNIPNLSNHDNSDELSQLLDEISYRSTILQKQLALAGEASTLVDLKEMSALSRNAKSDPRVNSCTESKLSYLDASRGRLLQDQDHQPVIEDRRIYGGEKVPITMKQNNSAFVGLYEGKPVCDKLSPRKKAANSIDSSVVSSILKETNVVDLQRQALIYLVDNAVLNTKLRETEHMLSYKKTESEKTENALKEEARLLMMENRELRISLDEQKMESNNLKSKLVMLERVLQSVSNENQELNWQLGESLNLQNLPKRGSLNYSPNYRLDNPVNMSRPVRRSSFSAQPPSRNCAKSKFVSSNASFLDATLEDPGAGMSLAPPASAAYRFRNAPIHSSTPMMFSQKQKEMMTKSPNSSDMSPTNFHSVKKCLKSSYGSDQENTSSKASNSGRCLDEAHSGNIPETFPKTSPDDTLPLEGDGKFPFTTILEKLKSNSEYRLSRSASAKVGDLCGESQAKSSVNKSKVISLQDSGSVGHFKETRSSQENSADINLQRKKGRNIQQRIQNILDRIVAESEEAS